MKCEKMNLLIDVKVKSAVVFLLCLVGIITSHSTLFAKSPIEPGYQAAYLYVGNSANDDEHHGDFKELQGIANGDPEIGDPYWYFSRVDKQEIIYTDPPTQIIETILYSVHYSEHLKNNFTTYPKTVLYPGGVTHCRHVGDLDYYAYNGKGYLLAGFDNCDDEKGYIGIFRANDLETTGDTITAHALLDITEHQGNQVLWVCVDANGKVYSGSGKESNESEKNTVYKYSVNWAQIAGLTQNDPRYLTTNLQEIIKLVFEDESSFIKANWQGADFSTDDSLFYFAEGGTGSGRLHVFDSSTGVKWKRVRVSKEPCAWDLTTCPYPDVYAAPFRFDVGIADEPEGISYFDMNGVSSYHPDMPRSELHVILLYNDVVDGMDNVHIKHYTGIVDVSNTESISDVYYNNQKWNEGIWEGAIMRLAPQNYSESFILTGKRVKIVSSGTATIQQPVP